MNNRFRFIGGIAMRLAIGLSCMASAATASAAFVWGTSNVSNNDTRHEVVEPVTTAINWGFSDWYVSAYIQTSHPNDGLYDKIYASYMQNLSGTWTQVALPLSNPYDMTSYTQSADPVLVRNDADASISLVGVTWNGPSSTCGYDNQISLWTSYNGGQSWSYPVKIYRNPSASGRFTDKPAAVVAKYGSRAGLVYVAFNDSKANGTCSVPGDNSQIRVLSWNPSSASVTDMGMPFSGTSITNPILYENPADGTLWVSAMSWDGTTPGIIFKVYDFINHVWNDAGKLSDSALIIPALGAKDCDDAAPGHCVQTAMGMTGRFNPVTGKLFLVWHHRISTWGSEVMYATGIPTTTFTWSPVLVSTSGDYSWNPAVEFDPSGNALVAYYAYPHATSASQMKYLTKARSVDTSGTLSAESIIFDCNGSCTSPNYSFPNGVYSVSTDSNLAALGEYQDIFYYKGYFNAVTVYAKDDGSGTTKGNIYHVRATLQ